VTRKNRTRTSGLHHPVRVMREPIVATIGACSPRNSEQRWGIGGSGHWGTPHIALVNAGTFVGAVCFFIGAALVPVESARDTAPV